MSTSGENKETRVRAALSIAGLDPSGGAGLIADVRTFDHLGVHPMGVASSITFQSTRGVTGRYDLPPGEVRAQLDTLYEDRRPDAVKTGMLGSAAVMQEVAGFVKEREARMLVVDPVIESGDGAPLLGKGGLSKMVELLLPLAALVTPNVKEASAICGFDVFEVSDIEAAALWIVKAGAGAVLVTGARREDEGGAIATDVYFDGRKFRVMDSPWIEGERIHGTGCVLSAAVTAFLASGVQLPTAVERAREVVRSAILGAVRVGSGTACADPTSFKETAGETA